MERIKESELIINAEGNIYHLNLKPDNLADNVILVGDPGRVLKISRYFDKIEHQSQNREIVAHTGTFNNKRISVLSTGMGTDNIDIVMNELDALVNIDFKTRIAREKLRSLNIVRLGTSGAIQPEIPVNTIAVSTHGIGMDGLLKFYHSSHVIETELTNAFIHQTDWHDDLPFPYIVAGSDQLIHKMGYGLLQGITGTAPGFYGPQGRVIRIPLNHPELMERIQKFSFEGKRVLNFEMETSALYGLGKLLSHNTLTMCAVIANRATGEYSKDYHAVIDRLIQIVLERLTAS
ncbi:MAG: nucleoside phosphorylase [Bacteroidales bacterium]|nr:nucleoside phosphorylase [Bacteroidales bacterium]